MTLRARPRPVLALLLAAATALALSVALQRPAAALVSADPDDGTCETNGRVNAVAYIGDTLYLGGSFTQVDGQARNRLAACVASTGALLPWNPDANGVVRALTVTPAGTRVFVGGDFTRIGGLVRARVASINPTNGRAFAFDPYVNSSVKALTTSSNGANVYVGGDFTSAEGVGRQHLAAFNAVSGALATAFRPNVSNGAGNFGTVLSMDLSPDGRTLYFCGDFSHVNGSSRRNAAAVSSGVATLRAWSPSSTASSAGELTLSASGNTVFVAGRSTGGYVQAYGPINGGTPGWNVNTNGDVEALAVAGTTLYVGGHYTSIAGAGRGHLAAMRTSGTLLAWDPGANGVFGAFGVAITSSHVAFGGEFTQAGGEAHQGVVQFSGAP
ncbi:MAG TPA: hypothetical protein VFS70_07510 [Actinomycetota bacterium]|nr:hypothetical protein [Actinomycetota bacterium]